MGNYTAKDTGFEYEELFENTAVAPGMFAATIINTNEKGHTTQVDIRYYTQMVHVFRERLKNDPPEKRQNLYSGAVNNLINHLDTPMQGADNAHRILSNILLSIICNPNKHIRRTILKGIREMIRKEGRAHLVGMYAPKIGIIWILTKGKDIRVAA